MAMKLDHEDLNRLIDKISSSDIQQFSLEGEDFKLEIKRNLFDQNQVINNLVSNASFDKQIIANQKPNSDNLSTVNEPEPSQIAPPGLSDLTEITSPMVGTFYRAAAPGEDPFVELGSNVSQIRTSWRRYLRCFRLINNWDIIIISFLISNFLTIK